MVDGIYFIEGNASISGVSGPRHLTLLIVKDGIATRIDGLQSAGHLIDADEVPVPNEQDETWGNLIIDYQQAQAPTQQQLDDLNAIKINIDPSELDAKISIILAQMESSGSHYNYDTNNDAIADRFYYDYDMAYNPFGPNSNSVANSLLSAAGISMREVISDLGISNPNDYVGNKFIVDGVGDSILQGFNQNIDQIFLDKGGEDTFYGGSSDNEVLIDLEDGFDSYNYGYGYDALAAGVDAAEVTVFDSSIEISDAVDGSTDTLYSIERINANPDIENHSVDFSSLSEGIVYKGALLGGVLDFGGRAYIGKDETSNPLEFNGFTYIDGTNYDDTFQTLFNTGLVIDTGAGNDTVTVGLNTEVFLGDGDDTLKFAGPGSIIHTGDGADKVNLASTAFNLVTDMSFEDNVTFFGANLTGAIKSAASELKMAVDGLVKYGINTIGDLVIENVFGGKTFISNYTNTVEGAAGNTGNILIAEADISAHKLLKAPSDWDATGIIDFAGLKLKALTGYDYVKKADPLIIDLDKDGIELTARSAISPSFDIDGDNFAEQVGWVNRDDGFLVRDLNSDGQINDISEMFGNDTVGGFTALSALDSNSDGIIDANDTDWSTLQVWQDLDGDAQVDSGELQDLNAHNITSIDLIPTDTTPEDIAGNTVTAKGTVTFGDATTTAIGDVAFALDNYNSTWLEDVTHTAQALALPELKAHGTLPNLRDAMSYDALFATIVDNNLSNLNTPDMDVLRTNIMPVLNAWMGVVPVASGNPGNNTRVDMPLLVSTSADGGAQVDDFGVQVTDAQGSYWVLGSGADVLDGNGDPIARPTEADLLAQSINPDQEWQELNSDVISFMERWFDTPLPLGLEYDGGQAAMDAAQDILNLIWHEWNSIIVKVAAQDSRALGDYFEDISYNVDTDKFEPTTDRGLITALENIFTDAPGTTTGDQSYIEGWSPFLDVLVDDLERGDGLVASYGYLFQNIVPAYENVGLQISITDTAKAFDIPEEIIVTGTNVLEGSDDSDIFYLDTGDQTAYGGNGPDNYVLGKNFGNDTIIDIEETLGADESDIVRFSQYRSDEVEARREELDLVITVTATGDELRIVDQFDFRKPSLFSGFINFAKGVNEIVFADGVVWDRFDIAKAVSDPTVESQIIAGTGRNDYLDGGYGDDILMGGDDSDVYVFGKNYGQDVITDNGDLAKTILLNGPDVLHLKDINFDEVEFYREGNSNDLEIRIIDRPDKVTITDQFEASYLGILNTEWFDRIEGFLFGDGITIQWDEIFEILTDVATTGADIIYGFSWEDTLNGGAGDDYLAGGFEGDTYIFGRGYGNDSIEESKFDISNGADIDRVIFTDDILPSDIIVEFNQNQDDLVLRIQDTGETLTLINQNKKIGSDLARSEIEEVVFDDGTIWTVDDLRAMALQNAITTGDDTIRGFYTDDVLDGGVGNDRLEGSGGGDTYLFGIGSGQDVVYDYIQYVTWKGNDSIQFTGGLNSTDVTLSQSGDDLVISINGYTDTLTVEKQFNSLSYYRIENFIFNDITLKFSDVYDIVIQSGGVNIIEGTDQIDDLVGDAGTDHIFAYEGDDELNGQSGDDVLDGGEGNDHLRGNTGDDTYIVSQGHDTIEDDGGVDTILFGEGITLNDLDIYRQYNGVTVRDSLVIDWGGGNSLEVEQHFYNSYVMGVENIEFSDGSTHNLINAITTTKGNDQDNNIDGLSGVVNDVIYGLEGDDRLYGKQGEDILYGGEGNDRLYGDEGDDILYGEAENDILRGHEGDDILYGGEGDDTLLGFEDDDTLIGGSGNDDIEGNEGNDILEGGDGDDVLQAGSGDDIIIYHAGMDIVDADLFSDRGGNDTLVFENNISIYDLSFIDDNVLDDTRIIINEGFNEVLITDHLRNDNYRMENLSFKDGLNLEFTDHNTWIWGDVPSETLAGTASDDTILADGGDDIVSTLGGNDQIHGGAGSDVLDGGAGDDRLHGGNGNDTLIYTLSENASSNDIYDGDEGGDTLELHFTAAEYTTAVQDDLTDFFNFSDQNRNISSVSGASYAFTSFGLTVSDIEELSVYVDGVLQGDYFNNVQAAAGSTSTNGTSVRDVIYGNNQSETIIGYEGSDIIYGQNGNDTIYGSQGADEIHGGGWADIIFGDGGWGASYGGDDLIYGDAGNDTINGRAGDDVIYGGTGHDTIKGNEGQDIIYGDAGADLIFGDSGFGDGLNYSDTIYGGDGNDTVNGLGGNDTIYGDAGNDALKGQEGMDYIEGGAGNDNIKGNEGKDRLYGGDDNDLIYGGDDGDILSGDAGFDKLFGENGNDILFAGAGWDYLDGGAGLDTFLFMNASDFAGNQYNRIRNYNSNEDVINIDNLLTGYDPLTDLLSDFVDVVDNGTHTYIRVDEDGAGSASVMNTVAFIEGYTGHGHDETDMVSQGYLIV